MHEGMYQVMHEVMHNVECMSNGRTCHTTGNSMHGKFAITNGHVMQHDSEKDNVIVMCGTSYRQDILSDM
jgi:hypothetical protein